MAERDDISIRITAEDDASAHLRAVAGEEQRLAAATVAASSSGDRAAASAARRADTAGRLKARLTELVTEQVRHQQVVAAGGEVDAAAEQAAQRRQTQIDRIGAALGNYHANQQRVNDVIRQHAAALAASSQAEDASAASAQRKAESAAQLKAQLTELIAEQQRHQQMVASGGEVDAAAAEAATQRQAQIEQTAAALAVYQANQQAANEAIRRHAAAMEGSVAADAAAEQATEKLGTAKSRLHERLTRLIAAQMRHQEAVAASGSADTEAQRVAARRQTQIDRIAAALGREERAANAARDAVRSHAVASSDNVAATSAMAAGLNALQGRIMTLAGSILGVGGVLAALRSMRQEMEENIRLTREFAEASLDLQFLSTKFNPDEREFVGRAAAIAGRAPTEAAGAYGDLKSRFPGLADKELTDLFLEISETARATKAPLKDLTTAFAGLFDETRDAAKSQNILRETIIQAGQSDPAVIANVLGKFLSPGQRVAGLTTAEAAGAVAGVTGLTTQRAEEQVTGLRTVALALAGRGNERGNEVLEREGIERKNFLLALQQIATKTAQGRISSSELQDIAGTEGVTILTALTDPRKLADFLAKVGSVRQAGSDPTDRTQRDIARQFSQDPLQAANYALKRAEAESSILRNQDVEAVMGKVAKLELQNELRSRGVSPIRQDVAGLVSGAASYMGAKPTTAATLGASAVAAETASVTVMANGKVFEVEPGEISKIITDRLGRVQGGGQVQGSVRDDYPRGSTPPPVVNNNQTINISTQLIASPNGESPFTRMTGRREQ